MKLKYYDGILNVGDELNPFIFKKCLKEYFNSEVYSAHEFYGIGTIIDQRLEEKKNAPIIIFGSGLRDISYGDKIKDFTSIDIQFVRGPLSSKLLNGVKYITDPAYLLHFDPIFKSLDKKERTISNKIGIIPYFLQEEIFKNFRIKGENIKIISPRQQPENFLKELSECEFVFAGAMHGAILADLLRIPWCRIKLYPNTYSETSFLSDFKWNDWALSVGIKDIPTIDIQFRIADQQESFSIMKNYYVKRQIKNHITASNNKRKFILSDKSILAGKIEQLNNALLLFQKQYPI